MSVLQGSVPDIGGCETVSRWFGGWPSFESAEIIFLYLMRKGEARLRVYPAGSSATVEFWLRGLLGVSLNGFSEQNFIRNLKIEKNTDGDRTFWRLEIEGEEKNLGGCLESEEIRVRVEPIEFSNPF